MNTDLSLYILENESTEEVGNIQLNTFDSDTYIYIKEYCNLSYIAKYIIKNEYTDKFITKVEANTKIEEKADGIELNVNKKLESYSTTEEMNSTIEMKADSITNTVSSTYATKDELSTTKSEIKQTTDSISSIVSKKVGNDEVIATINQSAEAVGINANKVNLTANDILNLIAGNAINLTSKNITIVSDFFNVDKDGNLTCSNATINNANIEGGNLKIWGNDTLDGVRVFKDSSKNTLYMAYMVSDSIGINDGNNNVAMTPEAISIGASTMYKDCIVTPTVTQTSLESEKKNFEKLENALDIIKKVDIYKYNLKNEKEGTKKHIGFVIGEKYKYSQELTSNDNQGVDIYSLASCCLAGVKEQQEQIEQLKQKDKGKDELIKKLMEKIEKLKEI